MTPGLDKYTLACIDENNSERGGTSTGRHVARVLLMPRSVGDDEFAVGGRKVPVGNVDGDALLAFGAKAVGEESEIEHACAGCSLAFNGMQLVLVDTLGVIEEAP